jgi:hypothetical protein
MLGEAAHLGTVLSTAALAAAALLITLTQAARAFDPPIVTEGPLTVRVQGPDEIMRTGEPQQVAVTIANVGSTDVSGTVRVQVIDRWTVEPADAQHFTAPAGGSARARFAVTAADDSFNGHYPIHALAEFEYEGAAHVAHPILVVKTQLQNPPRAIFPLEWKPVAIPENGSMALWRLRLRRTASEVVQSVAGADEAALLDSAKKGRPLEQLLRPPVPGYEVTKRRPGAVVLDGTIGAYPDEEMPWPEYLKTGKRQPFERDNGPEGLAFELGGARYLGRSEFVPPPVNFDGLTWIHAPALPGRVTKASVEYPLAIPKRGPVRLTFSNAIEPVPGMGENAKPAGVTFRVRVLPFESGEENEGQVVFEKTLDSHDWTKSEVDLSAFAGKTVRLRLEAALKDISGVDTLAYCAEPVISSGSPSAAAPFPPGESAKWRSLGTIESSGTRCEVKALPGKRGLLDAAVAFESKGRHILFNGFRVTVAGDALEEADSVSTLVAACDESAGDRMRFRHRFSGLMGDFDVVGELWIESNVLRASWRIENGRAPKPWSVVYLEDVSAGAWTENPRDIYLGHGYVLRQPGRFRLRFYGHTEPTSFAGLDFGDGFTIVQGLDAPPTDFESNPEKHFATFHTAHTQMMTFITRATVWEGANAWHDVDGLHAAPGVAKKAGRFTFDIWSGRYKDATEALRHAFSYGLTDTLVVWHSWQRWGYDNRLPDIYPPDPKRGTLDDMRALANVCRDNGALLAVHDNYVDFYPDAEGFSYDILAFTSERQVEFGWYNSGPQSQAYHPRADKLAPFVARNARLVKDGFAPTAYFIDVWANERPYDYWTSDGQFFDALSTRKAWGEAFAVIRDTLGDNAPTMGEAGNDQLIGWLDGADCQFNRIETEVPVPNADIERVPWFDSAHHDRFILHGVGYPERFSSGRDQRSHGIYSDDYMSLEALTGHAPMARHLFGRDVVAKYWLLNGLIHALALRRIDRVEFADGSMHRETVYWNSGATVAVNRGADDWTTGGHTLPEFGFYAKAPADRGNVESAIERRDGVIVEWSRSPELVYANARPVILDKNASVGQGYGGSRNAAATPDPRPSRMNPDRRMISFGAAETNGAFRLAVKDGTLVLTPLPSSEEFTVRLKSADLPWKVAAPTTAEAIDEGGKVIATAALKAEGGTTTLMCVPNVFAYRLK